MGIGVPELLAVLLLLSGSTRVPKLARSLGEASKEFRRAAVAAATLTDDVRAARSTPDRVAELAEPRAQARDVKQVKVDPPTV